MIDTVLFDLDGTLLPMDQEAFVKTYLGLLARYLEEYEYEPRRLVQTVWKGTGAMTANDGRNTNEEVFWAVFREAYGSRADTDRELIDQFYTGEFGKARIACGSNPASAELIRRLKERGIRLVLATNPLFPRAATMQRIRWAGLDPNDFELVTTYENASFCKPNPEYFRQILKELALDPARCIMVGNDAVEDLAAEQAGLEVFLLTDCLMNEQVLEGKNCPRGGFEDLNVYLNTKMQ